MNKAIDKKSNLPSKNSKLNGGENNDREVRLKELDSLVKDLGYIKAADIPAAPIASKVQLLGSFIEFNMNSTNDQLITLAGGTKFIVTDYLITNAHTSLNIIGSGAVLGTAADLELWSGANRSGVEILLLGSGDIPPELLRGLTNDNANGSNCTLLAVSINDALIYALGNLSLSPTIPPRNVIGKELYASLGTAEGIDATADIYVFGYIIE